MTDQYRAMSAPTFKALEWYRIKGRGWAAAVECDQERPRDGSDLIGRAIVIDGETFICAGIERNMPATPIYQGELITLLVKEAKVQSAGLPGTPMPNVSETGKA